MVPPSGGLGAVVISNVWSVKLAIKSLSETTVKVYEASVETSMPSSVQLMKSHPVFGVAITVTSVPSSYIPSPVVVPPSKGLADVVIS